MKNKNVEGYERLTKRMLKRLLKLEVKYMC